MTMTMMTLICTTSCRSHALEYAVSSARVSVTLCGVTYEYSHLVSSCAIQSESFFIVPRSRAVQVRPARDSGDPTTATANEAWYAIHIYQGANATGP